MPAKLSEASDSIVCNDKDMVVQSDVDYMWYDRTRYQPEDVRLRRRQIQNVVTRFGNNGWSIVGVISVLIPSESSQTILSPAQNSLGREPAFSSVNPNPNPSSSLRRTD